MSPESEHAWFCKRVAAFTAGLLDESEEGRFQEHLSMCERCREALETYSARSASRDPDAGHIPASLMARWDEARLTLRGLERLLVREHLEQCADCRQDLQLLGLQPSLDHVPELEPSSEIREAAGESGEEGAADRIREDSASAGARHPITMVQRGEQRARVSWPRWAFAGWAAVATAAALVLFIRTEGFRAQRPEPGDAIVPWVQPQLLRGVKAASTIEIKSGTRLIILPVTVPEEVKPDSGAVVEVFSPGDVPLIRASVSASELKRHTIMVVLRSPEPLRAGTYRVLFWTENPSLPAAECVESRFELLVER